MISHDWPEGITDYGDADRLFEQKPWFREGAANHTLGSPPTMEVLKKVQPRYWFAAHMHIKFRASVKHQVCNYLEKLSQYAIRILLINYPDPDIS